MEEPASCQLNNSLPASLPAFLHDETLHLIFFGGKGGVGKTTCAAATALYRATHQPECQFLLLSTDPAHSLCDVFADTRLPPNLTVIECDTAKALATFEAEHQEALQEILERGTLLDQGEIESLFHLALPGLDELLAFLEIAYGIEEEKYACLLIDTAPTGHVLRLLSMPQQMMQWLSALNSLLAKHRYLQSRFGNTDTQNRTDRFLSRMAALAEGMKGLLQDATRCRFVPVTLPETAVLQETQHLLISLAEQETQVTEVVVNGRVFASDCPFCCREAEAQERHLREADLALSPYTLWQLPLAPEEIRGVERLATLWDSLLPAPAESLLVNRPQYASGREVGTVPPRREKESLFQAKLLIFAGKGGVGKTTFACTTALSLAETGNEERVLLFSTDPAHSLSDCLQLPIGAQVVAITSTLDAVEMDAAETFQNLKCAYRAELSALFGEAMEGGVSVAYETEAMERLLDLAPPGLDELMALTEVLRLLSEGRYDRLVLDTAPTGHLLRLLEMPELLEGWLKFLFEVMLKFDGVKRMPRLSTRLIQMSRDLKRLRSLLHDPHQTALFAVALPTEMAFAETKYLMLACKRLNIAIPALILNRLTPNSDCALCHALFCREQSVVAKFHKGFAGVPVLPVAIGEEPLGLERLRRLGQSLYARAEGARIC